MSEESLHRFVTRLSQDPDFGRELSTLAADGDPAKGIPITKLLDFAKERGFEFSVEEVRTYREQLSDAQLDAVAGGRVFEIGTRSETDEEVAVYYNKIAFVYATTTDGRDL